LKEEAQRHVILSDGIDASKVNPLYLPTYHIHELIWVEDRSNGRIRPSYYLWERDFHRWAKLYSPKEG